jgi:hypothetical protein
MQRMLTSIDPGCELAPGVAQNAGNPGRRRAGQSENEAELPKLQRALLREERCAQRGE